MKVEKPTIGRITATFAIVLIALFASVRVALAAEVGDESFRFWAFVGLVAIGTIPITWIRNFPIC